MLKELLGLGIEPKDLDVFQVCLRGIIVFIAALIIVRVGHRRFLSRMTAFDSVVGFTLGSVLARAINGSAPLLPTLAVGFVLVLLHRFLSALAFRWDTLDRLLKGRPDVLVQNGKADRKKLRRHKITEKDLLEEAHLEGKLSDLQRIRTAFLERNGKISIIPE